MLQSVVAVLAGFALMVVVVMVTTVILVRRLKVDWSAGSGGLSPAYLTGNLVCSAIAALAGGWVTAARAPDRPLVHGIALALLMAAMNLLSMRQQHGRQPSWYPMTLLVAMPLIAGSGAWLQSLGR